MAGRYLRLLFHPATILALVALFVGAAGGAFATTSGLVGSAQIKDHSIKLIDLSPEATRGLRGRVGPQGPPGTFDPAKVTVVRGQTRAVSPGQEVDNVSVDCPTGSVAVGGGAIGGVDLESSAPKGATRPTGWFVIGVTRNNTLSFTTPVAVCAAP